MAARKISLKKLQRSLKRAIKQHTKLNTALETTASSAMWLREALECLKLARKTRRG